MIVGGVELTPESTVTALEQVCKLLGVGVAGSKQLIWQRLKKEAAENKLARDFGSRVVFGAGVR